MNKIVSYILDADVFITAKNRYYAFEICPGFWDCLIHFHKIGKVGSIDQVKSELLRGIKTEDLVLWVINDLPAPFFKSTADESVVNAFREIMLWVQRNSQYYDSAKAKFATEADGWLVAYSIVNGAIVVTNEQPQPKARNRIPLPDICRQFNVDSKNTFEMLHDLKVRLEWHGSP
ncbi:MAG: DUF4411 family protein [bacterium]